MTSSRTILIESNRLLRQGLKHLLADTRFAVEVEFSTIEQAVGDTVASGLVITGKASTEPGDLQQLREAYSEARIVVLASDPGRVAAELPVSLPAERDLAIKRTKAFLDLRAELEDQVRAQHYATAETPVPAVTNGGTS